MNRLNNKVAIITGAASGMGYATAKLFAQEGASLILGDINQTQLTKVVEELGGNVIGVNLNVTDSASWENAVKEAIDKFGKIDVLVNCAGIYAPTTVVDTTNDEWDKMLNVNAKSVYLGMKYVIPEMLKNEKGSIINFSSTAAIDGEGGAAYSASKGAISALSKNTASDYARQNIRVNTIHPGTILTPMNDGLLDDPETKAMLEALTPLPPHIGMPEDVGYGVVFLASDESKFMTGQELVIDGGWTTIRAYM